MKVLLATQKPFAAAAVAGIREILEGAGHEVVLLEKYAEAQDLINAVADVDAMIVRSDKVTPAVLEAAGKLKIVVRAGAGFDNIDLVVSKERGVVVENTPGQNSNAVAELAIAMMIYMCRNQFTPVSGCEISGKRLGIQAFGNVGRLVGKKAEALGMSVLAVDPFIPAEKIAEAGATPVASVKELYANSDFVSVHIPATPETIGSINYESIFLRLLSSNIGTILPFMEPGLQCLLYNTVHLIGIHSNKVFFHNSCRNLIAFFLYRLRAEIPPYHGIR